MTGPRDEAFAPRVRPFQPAGNIVAAHPLRMPVTPATMLRPSQPLVADQATKLRAMAAQLQPAPIALPTPARRPVEPGRPSAKPPRATVLAITSGKGGVGKSNVSVNLAITLAQSGKRVILIDADLGCANADVLCNVDVRANLAHVVARQRSLDEVMIDAPGGFKLVGGASGLAKMADLSPVDRQRLVAALADLESRADVILIDTGAGISPSVLDFTRAADHVLVVTTPEPTAITDAYAAIKVLTKPQPGEAADPARRMSLLVNQALSTHEASQVYDRVSKTARQFLGATVYDAGHVMRDDAVLTAVRARTPFVLASPRSAASTCIRQLAMRLGQAGPNANGGGGGFFERVSRRWFGN